MDTSIVIAMLEIGNKVICTNLNRCEYLSTGIYNVKDTWNFEEEQILILEEQPRVGYSAIFFKKVD